MKNKKQILTVIMLIIAMLLMINTQVKANNYTNYNLRAEMSNNSILLNWDNVRNADGYDIFANGRCIGSVRGNSAALINYQENTTYYLKVRAYEEYGYGKKYYDFSQEATIIASSSQQIGRINNLEISQENGRVNLSWTGVEKATKYQIFADVLDFGSMMIGEIPGNYTNVIIENCKDGERYSFKVRACQELENGEKRYSPYSDKKSIKVDYGKNSEDKIDVDSVKNIRITNVTENSANVIWDEARNVNGYAVYLSRNNEKWELMGYTIYPNFNLKSLYENTNYRVKIVSYKFANNKEYYGKEVYSQTFRTKQKYQELDNVKGIEYRVNKNNVNINWQRVKYADGYEIYLSEGDSSYFNYIGATVNEKYTFNELKFNTNYRVKIRAYEYRDGRKYYGDYSNVIRFTTERENKLGTVQHLTAEVKHRNEAYLQWWPVENADGYQIYVSKNGDRYNYYGYVNNNYTILQNLEYDTNYTVKVIAYKIENGKTIHSNNYSNYVRFKTERSNSNENNKYVGNITGFNARVSGDTVRLNWNKLYNADGYEIEFTVPGIGGEVKFDCKNNYRDISGLTEKHYKYTARVRPYIIKSNGERVYGSYSNRLEFSGR